MDKRAHIAAGIERNRIALLRMVFCWLSLAFCCVSRGHKPLPRRLGTYVAELLWVAEKATTYLLIASHRVQLRPRFRAKAFDRQAHLFIFSGAACSLGALTIPGIIARLKRLQHSLHNLAQIARRIAKNLLARARIAALSVMANAIASAPRLETMLLSDFAHVPP